MCQKPITRENAIQLVTDGKTELIKAFISRKGRPFDAFLTRQGARITWEFPPRESKAKSADGSAPKTRKAKTPPDLSKAKRLGKSKSHSGAEIYQTEDAYIVTKPNADGSPRVVFELKRQVCQLDIPAEEVERLLDTGRSELIEGFVSKRGSKFSAYLVLSKTKTKADFEFPPR